MNTYDRFRAMAIRRLGLISEGGLGAPLIVSKIRMQYNPRTSENEEIVISSFTTSGLRNNYRRFDIDGTLIKETDVNFYVSPICTTEVPDPDWVPDIEAGETEEDRPSITVEQDTPDISTTDEITFQNVKYKVITVRPWNHAGILIGYKVQGRVS